MKVGDLVSKPSSGRPRGLVGVVVDVVSRADEHLVGVSWPDNSGEIVFENPLWLVLVG